MTNQKLTKAQQEATISEHCKKWPDRPPSESDSQMLIDWVNAGVICQDTFEWAHGADPFLEDDEIEVAKLKDKERRRYWAIRNAQSKANGSTKRATTRRKTAVSVG